MSQPVVGRAGMELMFGSRCRGRRTAASTHGGGGLEVVLGEEGPGVGGGLSWEQECLSLVPSPGLERVRKQRTCVAVGVSTPWAGKVALRK